MFLRSFFGVFPCVFCLSWQVEEQILGVQQSKRAIARAVVSQENRYVPREPNNSNNNNNNNKREGVKQLRL